MSASPNVIPEVRIPLTKNQAQNIGLFLKQQEQAKAQVELLISTILDCKGYADKDVKVTVNNNELVITPVGGDLSSSVGQPVLSLNKE